MNKTKLFSILSACVLCVAIFSQCGEAKKSIDDTANKTTNMVDEAGKKAGDMVDEAGKKAGDMANDMKDKAKETMNEMDSKAGDLSFEAGSWADGVLQGMNSGSTTVFTLDQVPYEGEEISAAGKEQLDNLAANLKANPDWTAEIQGHTASPAKKLANGGGRAKWVQTKLVLGRGVKNKQLTSKGYGDEKLLPGIPAEDDKHKRVTVAISK